MNLVFDFDGTICDGTDTIVEILNIKFSESGHPHTTLQELRSSGLKGILSSRNLQMFPKTKSSGRKMFLEKVHLLKTFPGLRKTLSQLSQKHALGIITSNSRESVRVFLAKNKLDKFFSFIEGELETFGKNSAIQKIQADYYIGDETRDIEAARKAGVKAVSVTWGFESKTSLAKSHPDFIFTKPTQLLSL